MIHFTLHNLCRYYIGIAFCVMFVYAGQYCSHLGHLPTPSGTFLISEDYRGIKYHADGHVILS